ncbi:MAG: chemotaxis protein CheB [Rhodobacterales bacterium]
MQAQRQNLRAIAIGTSAGGVDALKRLVATLDDDLAAPVLIVMHVGARSLLPQILSTAGRLPACHAEHGQSLEPGRIYIAPPDRHMLVHDHHILLRRGPHENLCRPAIDPLFRTLACSYGPSAIGVVLTGALDDGTAGLDAIARCGGTTVVQDPDDAIAAEMPRSALRHVPVDHCVPLDGLGALLTRLATQQPGPPRDIPLDVKLEAAVAAQEHVQGGVAPPHGVLSPYICPHCQGPLWEIADHPPLRYRCHTGHSFTVDAMLEAQAEEAEGLLWTLMRSHQQRATLVRSMAERAKGTAQAAHLLRRAEEYGKDADMIRSMIERAGIGHEGDRQEPVEDIG